MSQELEVINNNPTQQAISKIFTDAALLEQILKISQLFAKSSFVPKDFINNPANIFVAIQMGLELGLAPMQSIQNISVINGRPCVWGDAMLALVQSSGKLERIDERVEDGVAYCITKRRGYPNEYKTSFSMADAKTAGLLDKNPWKQYPQRMLQMRARAFNLRDQYADILRGLNSAEEVADYVEITQANSVEKTNVNPPVSAEEPKLITEAQRKRLLVLWKEAGIEDDLVKKHLIDVYQINSTSEIRKSDYDNIVNWIKIQGPQKVESGVVVETVEGSNETVQI